MLCRGQEWHWECCAELGMALGMLCRAGEAAVQSSAGPSLQKVFPPVSSADSRAGELWEHTPLSPVPCRALQPPRPVLPSWAGVPTLSESSSMRVVSCTSGALGTTTGMGGRVLPRVPMDAVFTACTGCPGPATGWGHISLGCCLCCLLRELLQGAGEGQDTGNAFPCQG